MALKLNKKQLETKRKIQIFAPLIGVSTAWALSIAMTESSLGLKQESPTKCLGVFQMSSIAMKDLLQEMKKVDDDTIDIVCGLAFLKLLYMRWKSIEKATSRFCDPKDREFYVARVLNYMSQFNESLQDEVVI